MPFFYDITAVVVPHAIAGTVLLTGAAELVVDEIMSLDLEMDYFEREVAQHGAGITCVRVDLGGKPPEQVSGDIAAALAELLGTTPELSGWAPNVSMTEHTGADLEQPGHEDLDADAQRLLPSGDEIADRLIHEIRHEQSVYDAAQMFQAMPTEHLSTEDLTRLGTSARTAALQRAFALAGCLMHAADLLIDQLIEDIVSLRSAENVADERDAGARIDETWVPPLPRRSHYRKKTPELGAPLRNRTVGLLLTMNNRAVPFSLVTPPDQEEHMPRPAPTKRGTGSRKRRLPLNLPLKVILLCAGRR